MWPLKVDMTKDECRGALRHLELEAYSSVISTFRAQGSLDNFKQNVLDQLRKVFNISEDRHKAEVRRVANSEKLTTISELLTGKANDLEWIREGHRSYPLIARAPPYSALHILAEHASKAAAAENSSLPEPCDTRRTRTLDHEIPGKHIIMDDPTLPPPSPSVFGINRKELKKTYEMSTLQQTSRKKHYSMLKPPPPPNLKIQHLYQTLNTKRPRKSLTKKSSKIKKSSPSSRIQMHSPATQSTAEQKNFDNAELHRHLTSKLMPPPMSPMKSPTSQYQPILPATNKQRGNMQNIEPQAHYIPNNPSRLKSELLAGVTSPNKKQRVKSVGNLQTRNNYLQKFANGAGARMDHIPDPQIIFNTSSSSSSASSLSSSTSATVKIENEEHHHNQHEIDMSSQASPLQLLSTAASCTPKLKVNSSSPHQQQFQTIKTNVPNRAIKIIPTNSKPVVIKSTAEIKNQQQPLQQQQQSKIKIQKFQLMMNKNQDGTTSTANLSPTATIVSSKGGQFVLSGKNITNSYQVGKSPYAIVTTPKTTPKVVVQTMKENSDTNDNQIEFATNSNFPKVIIKSPATTTSTQGKQIKLKLGTSIVNTKILTKPLTSFTIQRNVNTKGFTVLNPSHIVQIQQQQQQLQQSSQSTPISITTTTSTTPNTPTESTKVDWEQELDDVNRTKGGKSQSKSNGSGTVVKKIKLDETTSASEEISQQENVIVETVDEIHDEDIQSTNQIVVFENSEETQEPQQNEIVSEFVYFKDDTEAKGQETIEIVEESQQNVKVNGDMISTELNGEIEVDVDDARAPQNGAEAYENLVKSLTDDYMKEIDEETIEENFGLIEGNMIDQFPNFTSQSGLF